MFAIEADLFSMTANLIINFGNDVCKISENQCITCNDDQIFSLGNEEGKSCYCDPDFNPFDLRKIRREDTPQIKIPKLIKNTLISPIMLMQDVVIMEHIVSEIPDTIFEEVMLKEEIEEEYEYLGQEIFIK
jgi:hypothetical protein